MLWVLPGFFGIKLAFFWHLDDAVKLALESILKPNIQTASLYLNAAIHSNIYGHPIIEKSTLNADFLN
jgi:hypothetical protein